MALNRQQKGIAATFQSLEQIGSAKAHQDFSGTRKILDLLGLRFCRISLSFGRNVIAHPVSGQE